MKVIQIYLVSKQTVIVSHDLRGISMESEILSCEFCEIHFDNGYSECYECGHDFDIRDFEG